MRNEGLEIHVGERYTATRCELIECVWNPVQYIVVVTLCGYRMDGTHSLPYEKFTARERTVPISRQMRLEAGRGSR